MNRKLLTRSLLLSVVVCFGIYIGNLYAGSKKEEPAPEPKPLTQEVKEWTLERAAMPYKGQNLKVIFEPWAGMQAFEGPVKNFEKLTGINVDIEYADYAERQAKTKSDFLAGTHIYDFSLVSWRELGLNVENNWVEPIEKFLNNSDLRDPSYDPWKLLPKAMVDDASLWKGVYYGVPCFNNTQMMVYRKDIAANKEERIAFKNKYGYELPLAPDNYYPLKNYQQYTDLCEFFTRKKGDKLSGKILTEDFYGITVAYKQHPAASIELENFMVCMGGWFNDDNGKPTMNSPELVNTLEYMLSLRKYCPPGYLEAAWDEKFSMYAAGRVFMENSSPDTISFMENPEDSKVAGLNGYFVPPIQAPGKYNVTANMAQWVIWKSSRHKEAAFLLIQYLNSYDAQLEVQNANGCTHDPRVMALPEIQKKYPWFKATLAIIDSGKIFAPPGYSWIPQASDIMAEAISKAAAGMVSVKTALDEAQARTVKLVEGR